MFVATNAHRDLFYNYWQYVVEMMAKADAAGNPAAKRALWTADGPQLGNRRTEIQEEFRGEYLANGD